jgi:hypothetical protein|tara:strand:+ start:7559 stop:7933 length:375 start_codon:yes stop_codon:yes gene_type:complete
MTEYVYRGIFVVTSAIAEDVNASIKQVLDEDGGEFTFTVGASPNGQEPITHYYCNSSLTSENVVTISQLAPTFPDSMSWVWVDHEEGDQSFIETVLDDLDNIFVEKKSLEEILEELDLKKMESE